MGANGEYSPETNADEFWLEGVWQENTNGWRVIVCCWEKNTPDVRVSVAVGSRVVNSDGGYIATPNGRFEKCELINSNGIIIQPKRRASMEDQFPSRMAIRSFPKWPDGAIKNHVGFLSNSPPAKLSEFRIRDVYSIKEEGDYTLTVCPVIYKSGTNADYLDRVDLPCVTTKVHLVPNDK
jgi:hypothetical protein